MRLRRHSVRSITRTGLTLIELIAAITLLSVLMTALLGLVPRFVDRAHSSSIETTLDHAWQRLCLEQVAIDYGNAHTVTVDRETLKLEGQLGRDPKTGQMNDRPDVVVYRWRPVGERFAVIREQGDNKRLICCGNVSLQMELKEDEPLLIPARESVIPTEFPTPNTFRLWLRITGDDESASTIFVTR